MTRHDNCGDAQTHPAVLGLLLKPELKSSKVAVATSCQSWVLLKSSSRSQPISSINIHVDGKSVRKGVVTEVST